MRGRRPAGPEYVEQLHGSEQARQRLRVVLETLAGRLRVQDACARLGIGEVRFHELRRTVLEAALAALEPRPAGRPARTSTATPAEAQALSQRLDELSVELAVAQLGEEIALILPGRADRKAEEENKTSRPRPQRPRSKKRPTASG